MYIHSRLYNIMQYASNIYNTSLLKYNILLNDHIIMNVIEYINK